MGANFVPFKAVQTLNNFPSLVNAASVMLDRMRLSFGQFVRVASDYPSSRAGKDGMVMERSSHGAVALVFGFDRHNEPQGCLCVGPELWFLHELDLNSVD